MSCLRSRDSRGLRIKKTINQLLTLSVGVWRLNYQQIIIFWLASLSCNAIRLDHVVGIDDGLLPRLAVFSHRRLVESQTSVDN
jgi:hypothetical protein